MRRRKQEGRYVVTGPHEPEKHAISIGAGISYAQNCANRRRKDAGTFTYYVTDAIGSTLYATVTKEEGGTIVTTPRIAA